MEIVIFASILGNYRGSFTFSMAQFSRLLGGCGGESEVY